MYLHFIAHYSSCRPMKVNSSAPLFLRLLYALSQYKQEKIAVYVTIGVVKHCTAVLHIKVHHVPVNDVQAILLLPILNVRGGVKGARRAVGGDGVQGDHWLAKRIDGNIASIFSHEAGKHNMQHRTGLCASKGGQRQEATEA
jgi:hypothetical protein